MLICAELWALLLPGMNLREPWLSTKTCHNFCTNTHNLYTFTSVQPCAFWSSFTLTMFTIASHLTHGSGSRISLNLYTYVHCSQSPHTSCSPFTTKLFSMCMINPHILLIIFARLMFAFAIMHLAQALSLCPRRDGGGGDS